MTGLSWKVTSNHVRRHLLEFILCVFGVAIGVAVVAGIDGAIGACVASFRGGVEALAGGASHSIRHRWADTLDDQVFIDLALTEPPCVLVPMIDRWVSIESSGRRVRVLGVDPFVDADIRAFSTMSSDLDEGALRAFMTEPGSAVITSQLAQRLDVEVGDRLTIDTGPRRRELHIVGSIDVTGPFSAQLADLVVTDIATAQELFDLIGKLDRIDVMFDAADSDAAAESLRAQLPDDVQLELISDEADELEELIASYKANLDALSLMASLVAVFIVYNATLVSVERRSRQLALLRCVGAGRLQLASLYLLEAGMAAVLGVVLGVAIGWLLAAELVGYVGTTINDLYAPVVPPDVDLTLRTIAKAAAVGLTSALIGTLAPMIRAAKVAPLNRLRRDDKDPSSWKMLIGLCATGALALLAAAALYASPDTSVFGGFVIALLVAVGFTFLAPLGLRFAAGALAALGRRCRSVPLAAAGAGVARYPGIAGTACCAMVLAVGLNVALLSLVQSFRAAVLDWLGQRLQADVFVGPTLATKHGVRAFLDPAVVTRLANQPQTGAYNTYRSEPLQLGDKQVSLVATQIEDLLSQDRISFRHGPAAHSDYDPNRHVLISEPLAGRTGLSVGAPITLQTPAGPKQMIVYAVFYDFVSERGRVMFSAERFVEWWDDRRINSMHVDLIEGARAGAVIDLWRTELRDLPVSLHDYAFIKAETTKIFDRTFRVAKVLGWLTAVVAFGGLTGALLALSMARRREYSILRALGATPAQMTTWLFAEAALIACTALLIGIAAGIVLAAVLAWVIQYRSFGWSIPLQIDPGVWSDMAVLVFGATVLSMLYPLWRVLRQPPAAALGSLQ